MPISAGELYCRISVLFQHEIELTAGSNTTDFPVLGIRVVESRDSLEEIRKYDAVFFDSLLGKRCSILDAAEAVNAKNASVLIVCRNDCSMYELEQLRKTCADLSLPLIEVNLSETLPMLVNMFYEEIITFYEPVVSVSKQLQEIIRMPEMYRHYSGTLAKYGFFENSYYCVAVCRFVRKTDADSVLCGMTQIYRFIESGLAGTDCASAVFSAGYQIAVIFADTEYEKAFSALKNGLAAIPDDCGAGYDIYTGISDTEYGIERLPVLYEFASKMALLSMWRRKDTSENCYSDRILDRLIISVKDREAIESIVMETLGRLAEYDRRNDTEYIKLLKAYFRNNCSIQRTSEELFVHRNSVNYGLRKIESIFDVSFSDISTRACMLLVIRFSELSGDYYFY